MHMLQNEKGYAPRSMNSNWMSSTGSMVSSTAGTSKVGTWPGCTITSISRKEQAPEMHTFSLSSSSSVLQSPPCVPSEHYEK
jgi:hypothetical protein